MAAISPSRPTNAGGRVPAPGLYGLLTGSTVELYEFYLDLVKSLDREVSGVAGFQTGVLSRSIRNSRSR